MEPLKPGDKAPNFTLTDQFGKETNLSDFKGKKLLVYFYPKADTPGCTKQACSIRDAESDLNETGVAALGISPDKPEKQKKFDDKYSLGFSLLSDANHEIASAYGAWGEKKVCGKTCEGILRSSFLIDEKGEIIDVKYEIKPTDTVEFVKNALNPSQPKKKAAPKASKPKPEPWVVTQSAGESAHNTAAALIELLKDIIMKQKFAVLSTVQQGEPYGNLVAFASAPDLKSFIIATSRETTKYKNITAEPKVALLIDNRSNEISDIGSAVAITLLGSAKEVSEADLNALRSVYIEKHPYLAEKLDSENNALISIEVAKFIVFSGPNNLVELTPA